jgi:hypothetical protein
MRRGVYLWEILSASFEQRLRTPPCPLSGLARHVIKLALSGQHPRHIKRIFPLLSSLTNVKLAIFMNFGIDSTAMCIVDVSLFECGDYTAHIRGPSCPNAVANGPCSRPDVAGIVSKGRSCVQCLYARTLETLITINESMLRWERKCAADAILCDIMWFGPRPPSVESLEEHERTIEEMKKKLESVREAQKFPLQFTGGTELSTQSQMLSIIKFQAQEMRSILLADDE